MLIITHYYETDGLGKYRCCLLEGLHHETEGKRKEMILSGDWVEMYNIETDGKSKVKMYGGQIK